MSSTELTTCEDAYSKPAFPLPPKLRMKVYEQLLIHPHCFLQPNGHFHRLCYLTGGLCRRNKNSISTSILRTCRTFYEESLPILYGKNLLHFHDNDSSKPVLPFPERHLTMVKYIRVDITPIRYSSAQKMESFLMALGTLGAKLVDVDIRINMLQKEDESLRELHDTLPPLSLFDRFLLGDHPIVAGLFSLKAVKILQIYMGREARFEPGVADALKEAFMKEGNVDHRAMIIARFCGYQHAEVAIGGMCPECGDPEEDLSSNKPNCVYRDDKCTWLAVEMFLRLGGKLKMRMPGESDGSSSPETDFNN